MSSLWSVGDELDVDKLNGVFTSYTPTWSSTGSAPSLGNGSIVGKWWRQGQTVRFSILLTAGSTTSFGTGEWTFTLPLAAESSQSLSFNVTGVARDSSAGNAPFPVISTGSLMASASIFGIWNPVGSSSNTVTNTLPFTWATSDVLEISGSYFAA
jgi:hypothetical protein